MPNTRADTTPFAKKQIFSRRQVDKIQQMLAKPYKAGFVTDIDTDTIPKGLSEETVRIISAKKNEPEWMLEFRLKAFRKWLTMEEPDWSDNRYPTSTTRRCRTTARRR